MDHCGIHQGILLWLSPADLPEVKQDRALSMPVLPRHRLGALGGDVAHLRSSGTAELQRNFFLILFHWFKL